MPADAITSLKEALKFSPDNVPLRLHLAELLLNESRTEEAIAEYLTVLAMAPGETRGMRGLARAYSAKGEVQAALVVLEELPEGSYNAETYLLSAKLHLKDDNKKTAADHYRKALELDASLTDEALDEALRQPAAYLQSELEEELENLLEESRAEKPKISFEDVGGMKGVKAEIEIKIIRPLEHQELYKAYGKKTGGGILLYGPPGCGKTYIARATAGQINAKFMSVGINDILDMWIGNSEKNLNMLFEAARAQNPCVLFFDEVDALGANRTDMKQSAGRHLINQFLAELDGVESSNDGVLILAATNTPWHLDPAFRRPGRFDRIIFVPPPDKEAREEILKIMLKEKPTEPIDYGKVAGVTETFSGADLNALIDRVVEQKLQDSFKTGIPEPIRTKDLVKTAKKMKPSTREWLNSARNYALYANEGGLYDDIVDYLKMK
ncbi:AAA family ATPase [Roseivirga sp. BDSF3-8]|uniref:AAA family ATPase n=1 Tax=Roseivirga sp. BDSF3-8 TaxID=3241598 RepID=UPI003531813C